MAGFLPALRPAVSSTNSAPPWVCLTAQRWQSHQQQRCFRVAATLPTPARQQRPQQQQQQQQMQQMQAVRLSRQRRLPVCNSFNFPEGFGANFRRLRGGGGSGSQDAANDAQDSPPEPPSVWSDWQGGAYFAIAGLNASSTSNCCGTGWGEGLPSFHRSLAAHPTQAELLPCLRPLQPTQRRRTGRTGRGSTLPT
jgi:hypothetical protein